MDVFAGIAVPRWVTVLVVVVLTASLLLGVPLARLAGTRQGRRLAHPERLTTIREKAKDTALFLAALVPSVLVWLAVMGVSFIGLTGFAAKVMHWTHWTNMLVPLSLDGISVSFGAWAFVAVKRGRHPGRAYKIVLAAAAMSAVLNFVHGRSEWSLWAGLYLAFLSMAGMAMFHELLEQFVAAYHDDEPLMTRHPRFGQRWLYAPVSTFAARRAWIVHPPQEGLRPSVRNALGHLEDVREARRQRRIGGAQRIREEQQAKLIEIHARNEVKVAKQRANDGEPVAAELVNRAETGRWSDQDIRQPLLIIPEPAASAEPAPRQRPAKPTQPGEPPLAQESAEPSPAEAEPAEPGQRSAKAVQVADPPAPESAEPSAPVAKKKVAAKSLPETGEQPLIAAIEAPVKRPPLKDRVPQILDAHVRAGDDLQAARLTNFVLRALAAPANRDTVGRHVQTWLNQVQRGRRALSAQPRQLLGTEQNGDSGRLEFPFDVLVLQRVVINNRAVVCPGCGTEESLMFSGQHPRRPVEANCGCGERWPIVGLGSERVWETLVNEVTAGQAEIIRS
ncbi:MAG TPA: hypothetical protein DGT23_29095 [Micromonosporaceae bacterium]|nr:hypothetical protein [Micromonosporaceae bacterium]